MKEENVQKLLESICVRDSVRFRSAEKWNLDFPR